MNRNIAIIFSLLLSIHTNSLISKISYSDLFIEHAKLLVSDIKKSAATDFYAVVRHFDDYCANNKIPLDQDRQDNRMPTAEGNRIITNSADNLDMPVLPKLAVDDYKRYYKYDFLKKSLVQGIIEVGTAYTFEESLAAAGIIFASKMIDQDLLETHALGGNPLSTSLEGLGKAAYEGKHVIRQLTWLLRMGIKGVDKKIAQEIYAGNCLCDNCIKLLAHMTRSVIKDRLVFHVLQDGLYTKLLQQSHNRYDYRFKYQENFMPNYYTAYTGGCCSNH